MASVAVICMYVWQCPHCEVALKARTAGTVFSGSEYHLLREHDISVTHWDPVIELCHWAFNIRPDVAALLERYEVAALLPR